MISTSFDKRIHHFPQSTERHHKPSPPPALNQQIHNASLLVLHTHNNIAPNPALKKVSHSRKPILHTTETRCPYLSILGSSKNPIVRRYKNLHQTDDQETIRNSTVSQMLSKTSSPDLAVQLSLTPHRQTEEMKNESFKPSDYQLLATQVGLRISEELSTQVDNKVKFLHQLAILNTCSIIPLPTRHPIERAFVKQYNLVAQKTLLHNIQSLGLKLPQQPDHTPFLPHHITDRDDFLKKLAIRNNYGRIPSSKQNGFKKTLEEQYEKVAHPLRALWLKQHNSLKKILKITKNGLIQILPFSEQHLIREGTAKTIYSITMHKATAQKKKVLALVKPSALHEFALKDLLAECAISHTLQQNKVPHVIRFRQIKQFDPTCAVREIGALMDLYEGDFFDLFCPNGIPTNTLTEKENMTLALELAQAVQGLHEKAQICHCDLKAENVFIRRDKEGHLHVVVADFGMSSPIQNMVQIRGTHLSPEQFQQICADHTSCPISPKVDLWCLGDMLSTLRNQIPFPLKQKALDFASILAQLKQGVSPSVVYEAFQAVHDEACQIATNTHNPIDSLIAQLFSLDPSQRPSAQSVVTQLTDFMKQQGFL